MEIKEVRKLLNELCEYKCPQFTVDPEWCPNCSIQEVWELFLKIGVKND